MRHPTMPDRLPFIRRAAFAAALLAGLAAHPAHAQSMPDHAGMDHASMPGMNPAAPNNSCLLYTSPSPRDS